MPVKYFAAACFGSFFGSFFGFFQTLFRVKLKFIGGNFILQACRLDLFQACLCPLCPVASDLRVEIFCALGRLLDHICECQGVASLGTLEGSSISWAAKQQGESNSKFKLSKEK